MPRSDVLIKMTNFPSNMIQMNMQSEVSTYVHLGECNESLVEWKMLSLYWCYCCCCSNGNSNRIRNERIHHGVTHGSELMNGHFRVDHYFD